MRKLHSIIAAAALSVTLASCANPEVMAEKRVDAAPRTAQQASDWNKVKLYFLAQQLYYDLNKLDADLRRYPSTSGVNEQKALIQQLNAEYAKVNERKEEFRALQALPTVKSEYSDALLGHAVNELQTAKEDLATLNDDPSSFEKEGFTFYTGSGPQDWLAGMQKVANSVTSREKNSLSDSIEYHYAVDAATLKISRLLSASHPPREQILDEEQLRNAYGQVDQRAAVSPAMSLRASGAKKIFQELLLLVGKVKALPPDKPVPIPNSDDKSPWAELKRQRQLEDNVSPERTKLWEGIWQKLHDLEAAEALRREELLNAL